MTLNEATVAKFVADVDDAVREHGFFSENVIRYVAELIDDEPALGLYLCRFAMQMATQPDTLWSCEVREFVEALEECNYRRMPGAACRCSECS